jgi:hypothetical protein
MFLQAEQGQGCYMSAAGPPLSSDALAALSVTENKTSIAPALCHMDYGPDIIICDQACIAALKREKMDFIVLQQP